MLSDRLLESLGGRSWLKRKNNRAMRRLRAIFEDHDGAAAAAGGSSRRVTVAAG